MKQVVYKYCLADPVEESDAENVYHFPPDAKLLHVGTQENQIFMWVLHPNLNALTPQEGSVKWVISPVFTGETFEPSPEDLFIGTTIQVWSAHHSTVIHWFKREETV